LYGGECCDGRGLRPQNTRPEAQREESSVPRQRNLFLIEAAFRADQ
jgi:hypothetical protein